MEYPYPQPLVWLIWLTAGLLGSMVGSFLNVCIYRLPREYLSIVSPRSHCPACGSMIAWYDNIPIISWFCLTGLCRHCRSRISIRYLLVEVLTTVLFLVLVHQILLAPHVRLYQQLSLSQRWFVLGLFGYLTCVLIITSFIDFDYRIVPDEISLSGVLLAPLVSTICPVLHQRVVIIDNIHLSGLVASLFGILIGGGVIYVVGVAGKLLLKKEAMGFGDVKFMAMIGGLLGWDAALLVFFSACLLGSVIGGIIMIFTKDRYTPFVPYLATATLLIMLAKQEVLFWVLEGMPRLLTSWMLS